MKSITLTIAKKDIFYGVDSITHVFAESLADGNANLADIVSTDTVEDFYKHNIASFADAAIATLRDRLARYLSSESTTTATTAYSTSDYTIKLSVENRFNNAVVQDLTNAALRFVVDTVLAHWFAISGSQQSATYAAKADFDIAEAERLLYKKVKPSYE